MSNSRPTKDAAALMSDEGGLRTIVTDILHIALNVGGREFGCERCSICTIKISEVLTEWLMIKPADCRGMFLELEHFLYFPHAMMKMLNICIDCAKRKKDLVKLFATQLNIICNRVTANCNININEVASKHTLSLSRLAAIIEILRERIEQTLRIHRRWDMVKPSIEALESKAGELESFLENENALSLFKEEKKLKDGTTRTRPKRVCGGGVLDLYVGKRSSANIRKVYVVNFSPNHISGLVTEPIPLRKKPYQGDFQPCQRELPFVAKVAAVKRRSNGRTYDYIDIDNEMLPYFSERHCGVKYYQVFEIKDISPYYYYLSLCACLTPTSKRYRKSIVFLDKHDIPKSTSRIPVKEYCPDPATLKRKGIVKIKY